MGMAASQVRLLQLTGRKNDIGRQLQHLSLEKTSLTREMKNVTKDYQEALNSKVLKWTNNSGVSYVDLSYSNLMTPSSVNNNTPYIITNGNGAVLIDNKYKKYAEMISSSGASGGNYEAVRSQILASLCTGLSEEDINNATSSNAALNAAADKVNQLKGTEPEEPVEYSNANDFIKNAGTISGVEVADGGTLSLGNSANAKNNLKTFINTLANNMGKYLGDEDKEAFEAACNAFYDEQSVNLSSEDVLSNEASPLRKNGDNYTLDLDIAMENILGRYAAEGGDVEENSYGTMEYAWRDKDSTDYKDWETKHSDWQTQYDDAMEEYNKALDTNNQALTSSNETEIAFYDKLFTAIAEKGWEYNSKVEDTNYLNQMLQNNQYYITTMSNATDENGKNYYEYDSNIATNFDNIVPVNDSDAANEALVDYEYEKSIINEKETRVDTRMKDLQTEQAAIDEMIKGIESVRNDNTERTFSIFS